MNDVEGVRTFGVAGAAYDSFMGRYSGPLAALFADAAEVRHGHTALDVGCGPGALTSVLAGRLGAGAVAACDPTDGFAAECARRHPGVQVEVGRAEALPFDKGRFDHALAQLVLHFVSDPQRVAAEMLRVVREGGRVAACVWDFDDGMEMLRAFWDAALELDDNAPDEARTLRFGRAGEIAELFEAAGAVDVVESTLHVSSTYSGIRRTLGRVLRRRRTCRRVLRLARRTRQRSPPLRSLRPPGAPCWGADARSRGPVCGRPTRRVALASRSAPPEMATGELRRGAARRSRCRRSAPRQPSERYPVRRPAARSAHRQCH